MSQPEDFRPQRWDWHGPVAWAGNMLVITVVVCGILAAAAVTFVLIFNLLRWAIVTVA